MPGWGRSPAVRGADRDHGRDAIELLDALGVERFAVVGNSMGGATAIRLAVDHPDRVTHLITMGAVAPGPRYFLPGGGPSEGLAQVYRTYRDPSPEGMRALVEMFTFDPAFATEELVEERSAVARFRPDHLANFIADPNVRRRSATLEEIATITAPTLVLHGRDDRVIPVENSLMLISAIPDSRAVIVNRCGHWLMLEHQGEFSRLVSDFILHT
jgi:2-hydroxy-6-oxonona-2,4-dienedioate hydrolase